MARSHQIITQISRNILSTARPKLLLNIHTEILSKIIINFPTTLQPDTRRSAPSQRRIGQCRGTGVHTWPVHNTAQSHFNFSTCPLHDLSTSPWPFRDTRTASLVLQFNMEIVKGLSEKFAGSQALSATDQYYCTVLIQNYQHSSCRHSGGSYGDTAVPTDSELSGNDGHKARTYCQNAQVLMGLILKFKISILTYQSY